MSTSVFSLTGRDRFQRPRRGSGSPGTASPLDASFVLAAQDAVNSIEALLATAVRTESTSARSTGLSVASQYWSVAYDGSHSQGGSVDNPYMILNVSPAFLEDAGVIPAQSSRPSDPAASLAGSVAAEIPVTPTLPADLAGLGGLAVTPGWVDRLSALPLLRWSVRREGATSTEAYGVNAYAFFDAGSGVSPRVLISPYLSLPSQWQAPVPSGQFDIGLLALNWGS